ncbi:hypothetical protein Daudx_0655 [Candidatus Desulforudis audaxviator]|nr:hypothetical protein Daudx_0655 [Candidatus Desulforudis audaxviator]
MGFVIKYFSVLNYTRRRIAATVPPLQRGSGCELKVAEA